MLSISISTLILIIVISAIIGGGIALWVNIKIIDSVKLYLLEEIDDLQGIVLRLQGEISQLKRAINQQSASLVQALQEKNQVKRPESEDQDETGPVEVSTEIPAESSIDKVEKPSQKVEVDEEFEDFEIPAFLRRQSTGGGHERLSGNASTDAPPPKNIQKGK